MRKTKYDLRWHGDGTDRRELLRVAKHAIQHDCFNNLYLRRAWQAVVELETEPDLLNWIASGVADNSVEKLREYQEACTNAILSGNNTAAKVWAIAAHARRIIAWERADVSGNPVFDTLRKKKGL